MPGGGIRTWSSRAKARITGRSFDRFSTRRALQAICRAMRIWPRSPSATVPTSCLSMRTTVGFGECGGSGRGGMIERIGDSFRSFVTRPDLPLRGIAPCRRRPHRRASTSRGTPRALRSTSCSKSTSSTSRGSTRNASSISTDSCAAWSRASWISTSNAAVPRAASRASVVRVVAVSIFWPSAARPETSARAVKPSAAPCSASG